MGDRHGHPAPERMQYPVSLISRVQIVVKEPGDCLSLLRLGVITRGAHGRVSADQVVETELTGWGSRQQVMIEQSGEGFFCLGEGAAAQGRRGLQADRSARAHAQPPEEPLMVGFQRPVGQVEGGHHFRACRARAAELSGRLRKLLDQVGKPRRAVLREPAGGELDRERQAPAQSHGRGDLILVLGPAGPAIRRNSVIASSMDSTSRVSVRAPSRSGSLRRVVIKIRHRPATGSSGRIWSSRAASSRITTARRRLS